MHIFKILLFIYFYVICNTYLLADLIPNHNKSDKNDNILIKDTTYYDLIFKNHTNYVYDLYWGFIKVGKAKLEFQEITNIDKEEESSYYEIRFTVISNSIINTFYPLEIRITSNLNKTDLKPFFYKKSQIQGNDIEQTELLFDWNKMILSGTRNNKKLNEINLTGDCKDPLSMILNLCYHDFQIHEYNKQVVSDGKKILDIQSKLEKIESVNTSFGIFNCHKISIDTKDLRGVFKKSPNAKVFMYLDTKIPSIPIKLSSKVVIGKFHALLSDGNYYGEEIKSDMPLTNKKIKSPKTIRK